MEAEDYERDHGHFVIVEGAVIRAAHCRQKKSENRRSERNRPGCGSPGLELVDRKEYRSCSAAVEEVVIRGYIPHPKVAEREEHRSCFVAVEEVGMHVVKDV